MKKLLLAGLILCSFILRARGQEKNDKKKNKTEFLQALVIGLNGSRIHGETENFDGSLLGGQLGIIFNVLDFSASVSLRAEVNYSMIGGKYKHHHEEGEPGKLRLNYVTLPCVVRYQASKGFFAEAGLQPALLISAKDKYQGASEDYKELVNKFDLGLPVGVGYETRNRIGIGVRVVPGLTKIHKELSYYGDRKDRNFVVSLRATFSL